MTDMQEKALQQMYDKYMQTGVNDWQTIDTLVGNQLVALGFVTGNVLGEFQLTNLGIAQMSK